jgi:hypothetical protein
VHCLASGFPIANSSISRPFGNFLTLTFFLAEAFVPGVVVVPFPAGVFAGVFASAPFSLAALAGVFSTALAGVFSAALLGVFSAALFGVFSATSTLLGVAASFFSCFFFFFLSFFEAVEGVSDLREQETLHQSFQNIQLRGKTRYI